MAAKTVRQLREDVTARIVALGGWVESRVAPDAFGRDADSITDRAFAVRPVATSDLRAYRGRPAEGLLVETDLAVHYCRRLKPTGMSTSYDVALDAEQALINCMMAYDAAWPASYKVQFLRSSRATAEPGEWVLGMVEFRVIHTLPLQ